MRLNLGKKLSKYCLEIDLKESHKHSSNHRAEIESSSICGCFYCLSFFPPKDIENWIDNETTALCPKCNIDSVIGDSYKTISPEFLKEMQEFWFENKTRP